MTSSVRFAGRVALAACVLVGALHGVRGASWKWLSEFTPESAGSLKELHEELLSPRLSGVLGVPVRDVRLREDFMEIHLRSGTVFLEPPVRGCPAGAYFVGEGTFRFVPEARKTRQDLEFWFGAPTIEAEPIRSAYFFSLGGASLLERLGVSAEPSVPLAAPAAYEEAKLALRQTGTMLLRQFLNREGRSKGTLHAVLEPGAIRDAGEKEAFYLYSLDPAADDEVSLSVFGHSEVQSTLPHKYYFHKLAWCRSKTPRFVPQAKVDLYSTKLQIGGGLREAEEETTVTLIPDAGTRALTFALTPRMRVRSVTGPGGEPLPFVQWGWLDNDPNYDATLVVELPPQSEPGKSREIRTVSSGRLFEPWYEFYWLADEDAWHPLLADADEARYETFLSIPKSKEGIAAGRLVEDSVRGAQRHYHYRTERPHKRSTVYFGDFDSISGEADDTEVGIYIVRGTPEVKNLKYALAEIVNMIRVYNRLYAPLDQTHIRVTSTPTSHGRGFEGIILLSQNAGFAGARSGSDLFRAHEVAHQWWGNIVRPLQSPEDRWLSEAFAEFSAMEYYRIRFESDEKTLQQVHAQWIKPLLDVKEVEYKTVRGEKRTQRSSEISPVIDGGGNVYTKGPMVLHMLRYLFRLRTGGDDAFWTMLRTFLDSHEYQAASTSEFAAHATSALGADLSWFWDQWIYRTEIPVVWWKHELAEKDGKWLLRVNASQDGTSFKLWIPVYAHFSGGRTLARPLVMDGPSGSLQILLPEKPESVSLNDGWESLVRVGLSE